MHRDACEATLVREEQSPELMDLRMACLDERRTEFVGLTEAFARADVQLVERAVDVTGELRGLARCDDREQLLAAYPLPDSEAQRLAIETLRDELAAARARLAAGKLEQVRGVVDGYVAATQDHEFPPLQAEALLLKSAVEHQSGRGATAKEAMYAAAAEAVLARENELVARAWIALSVLLVENEGDAGEAMDVLQLAQSYIAQLPMGHPLEARFHDARARALALVGNDELVVKNLRVAVDISRAADHPALVVYLGRLSRALGHLYQLDEAQAVATEAIARAETTFGRNHPNYASALVGAAGVATLRGNHDEALRLRELVVGIIEAAYPPDHPRLVTALERLAWSLKETGRYNEAIAAAERALAVESAFETPRWGVISHIHNTIGDVHVSRGNYPLAVQALEAALAAVEKSGNKPMIGLALGNLGNTANRAGEYAAAEAYCRDALTVDEAYLAEDHPDLGYSLSCIGEALLGAGKPTLAIVPLRRAHSVRDRLDIAEGSLAWTRWLYGRALWESEADKSLGLTYVGFAHRVFNEMGESTESELSDVAAWLNTHDLMD
jgi:tetratricopeptide (TPR) repeat protein